MLITVDFQGKFFENFPIEELLKKDIPIETIAKGLKDAISNNLKTREFQRLQKVLSDYGYKDLGDVQYWHSQDPDDPEPKGLLEWYKAYDDAIWEEIGNLQNKTFEELQNYDPVAVENQIFEKTKEKLPKEGE